MAKRASSRAKDPVQASTPNLLTQQEVVARFIRAVWECLANVQIQMDLKTDLFDSQGRESYVSKPSKRQERGYEKRAIQLFCEPRITIQSIDDGCVAQITIEIQHLQVCHESMRDLLRGSFNRCWKEEVRIRENRTSDTIWADAQKTATGTLIHYLRARQACRECMIESERLEREAIRFARLVIDAANGN